MQDEYEEILKWLGRLNFSIPHLPKNLHATDTEGVAYSVAYPIQGLLKYHGMSDFKHRIANFSSISLNNDCALTRTFVSADKSLSSDKIILKTLLERGLEAISPIIRQPLPNPQPKSIAVKQ